MQKHVRIVLSILQNFLAISVDRILSALKTTQLFETEIVWKYVLNEKKDAILQKFEPLE